MFDNQIRVKTFVKVGHGIVGKEVSRDQSKCIGNSVKRVERLNLGWSIESGSRDSFQRFHRAGTAQDETR